MSKPKTNSPGEDGSRDNCYSPYYALDPVMEYIGSGKRIWEPCCGSGNLVTALAAYGNHVYGTDLLLGQDFLTYQPEFEFDLIVTNPPYSNPWKYRIISRCYWWNVPFALVVPVDTLGAGTYQALCEDYGFEWIYLKDRIHYDMPDKGWSGKATFNSIWIARGLVDEPVVFTTVKPRGPYELNPRFLREGGSQHLIGHLHASLRDSDGSCR